MAHDPVMEKCLARVKRLLKPLDFEILPLETAPPSVALIAEGIPFAQLLDPATAALHCPVQQKVMLLDISPDIYFETDAQIGQALVLVNLETIDDEELALRLSDARKASKLTEPPPTSA